MGRSLFLCLIAITFLLLAQTAARADEVTISGSATGNAAGVPQLTFERKRQLYRHDCPWRRRLERLEQPSAHSSSLLGIESISSILNRSAE